MYTNKKIFILGMARSGYEAAKLLIKMNNDVLINDQKKEQNEEHVKELKSMGIKVVLGEHPDDILDKSFDYLIKNPGIADTHKYVAYAKENNIPVINEVELAYHLFPKDITIVGITGSNGKTTTTTLTYEIIKKAGKNTHLMGNIGYPVTSFIGKIQPQDILVMEISDHQLCNMYDFKTDISVLINLYEAHLDLHGTYETYKNVKKRIFNHHTNKDYAILNMDNDDVMELTKDIKSTKSYFSSKKKDIDGSYIKDNAIYYQDDKIIDLSEIKIKGNHNYENIMAAIMVSKLLGVSNGTIKEVLMSFGGVEHRIEFVKTINKRDFYNDSKSTNVTATQIALKSMDKPTILLLGGLDRGHSFEDLRDYMKNVKLVACYGQTKDRIKQFASSLNIDCCAFETLKEATEKAYEISSEGDAILLSPACASWDQFDDFEQRGFMFKKYIDELK